MSAATRRHGDSQGEPGDLAISIRRLSFSFFNAGRPSLDDVSLDVKKGEFLAITGPSGCGKSTLASAIGGYIPHVIEGHMEGTVEVCGRRTAAVSLVEMATLVGIVQQDPEAQLCTLDVDDEVAFGPENLALPVEEVRRRVAASLAMAGASHLRGRSIFELSGGEKQRVAIASMLAMKPAVLILDEPTSNLDPGCTSEVLATISRLKDDAGMTILVIEHKLGRVLPLADRLIVMDGGRIALDGRPRDVLETYRARVKEIGVRLPGRVYRHHVHPSPSPRRETVRAEGLRFAYDGHEVLHGISFTAHGGEIVGLIGPNGSGKSTFLAHLPGLHRPSSGRVLVLDEDIRHRKVSEMARRVGLVFQNPNHQIFERTVSDEVSFACRNFGFPAAEVKRLVATVLQRYGLSGHALRHPMGLSFGEKRRVNLCSVLPHGPEVLVLDEPFVGQDFFNVSRMMGELEALRDEGRTILLVSHDIDMVYRCCDRVVLFRDGAVAVDDAPAAAIEKIRALGMYDYLPGGAHEGPVRAW